MSEAVSLTSRGLTICRACHAEDLQSVLDLGAQPIANELLPSKDAAEQRFPLHLRICRRCGLGQVGEFVLPERIFGDYPYLSSVSTSWVSHARNYAQTMYQALNLADGGRVVEIASNDGYLLREFIDLGGNVLGVEPAANVAEIARAHGVETINTFFGRGAAEKIVAEHGHPKLIVANNVLAHVPDLDDFVGGLAVLCGPETMITIENPSLVTLLRQTQFDTIYHEHFSYLSAHAVQRLAGQHGLALVKTEDLPTHGGSYRYWISRAAVPDSSVSAAIARELDAGLLSPALWNAFSERSHSTIEGLLHWLTERHDRGVRVAGYGAAAKGNTLLNAAGAQAEHISVVADGSPEKQGKYLPGSRIPIVAPDTLADSAANDVLILPWNLEREIGPLVATLTPDAQCWVAIPQMRALAQ
jgi:hypothetical protein